MGCDIHLYRERKVDGIWETDTIEEAEDDGEYMNYQGFRLKDGRSYTLFSALSGVRSYGEMLVQPPAENRGWPDDVCEVNQRCSKYWVGDAHTHGWLTIAEVCSLKDQWEQAIVLYENTNRSDPSYTAIEIQNLIESMQAGDYFQNTHPDEGRILFFYDN